MGKEAHAALKETNHGLKVLDWLIQAYGDIQPAFQFVGGFKVDEIERKYPQFEYLINEYWEQTGATGSLFCANLPESGDLIVTYSDILYRKELVNQLIKTEEGVVVVIDSHWKDRYRGRSQADMDGSEKINYAGQTITRLGIDINSNDAQAEFIGLAKFSETVLKLLNKKDNDLFNKLKKTNLSGLIEWLRIIGFSISFIDAAGDWAEMDDPRDLAHFVLGTKAQTLDRLSSLVEASKILDQYVFSVRKWQENENLILDDITNKFPNDRLVARSSALSEDGFSSANAGAYDSILNINNNSREDIRSAVSSVIESYKDRNPDNQVLIQPMLKAVAISGVGFTRTLSHGAPYYVLNYDDVTGLTDSITSGNSIGHKTLLVRRDKLEELKNIPQAIQQLCRAFREIELLVNYDSLDIEFAIDRNGKVFIFQVRPIAVDHSEWNISDEELFAFIRSSEDKFLKYNKRTPGLEGGKAVFGVMPDWNPAEIIGVNPGRLATSLYQEIIMNDIWSTQRMQYGYRDARPAPLLVTFGAHPYVDVRASFNSFVPASLPNEMANRLVDFYLNYLKKRPEFHDKVEFEVVPTCFDLNFKKWVLRFSEAQFSKKEIVELRDALKVITNQAIMRNEEDYVQIGKLESRFSSVVESDLDPLIKAYYLLEDCKEYGTLPFSHLARSAFVAVSFLKSAVETGVLSKQAKDDFLNTIHTVSHSFTEGIQQLAREEIRIEDFLGLFGHIRPGTYDIGSKNYREDPEYYILPLLKNALDVSKGDMQAGSHWNNEKESFMKACNLAGINHDPMHIESFMRKAIEGREYAKYLFSRNLSMAMEYMMLYCESIGLNREELSHITWQELFASQDLCFGAEAQQQHLKQLSETGRRWKQLGARVELPPLLTSVEDFWWFYYPESQPNFIGSGHIIADCVDIASSFDEETDLTGKIVMIPRADPGYEWLFGRKIGGLITMYGGANSHMAIRAAEFNLPAAIGIGEKHYDRISGARILSLNSANRKIEKVQ